MVGVKVSEGELVNNYALTNEKGFFKLKYKREIDNESNLVFTKQNYKDTIVLIKVNNYHPPTSNFLFLTKRADTLKMIK